MPALRRRAPQTPPLAGPPQGMAGPASRSTPGRSAWLRARPRTAPSAHFCEPCCTTHAWGRSSHGGCVNVDLLEPCSACLRAVDSQVSITSPNCFHKRQPALQKLLTDCGSPTHTPYAFVPPSCRLRLSCTVLHRVPEAQAHEQCTHSRCRYPAQTHGARRTCRINLVLLAWRLHRAIHGLAKIGRDARLQVRLAPFLVQAQPLQHLRGASPQALA